MTAEDDGGDGDAPRSDVARRAEGGIERGGPNKWTKPGGEPADSDGSPDESERIPPEPGDAPDGVTGDAPDTDSDADDVPLSDLARRVEDRRSDDAAREEAGSLFESMSVESMDADAAWTGLVESDADGPSVGASGLAESVEDDLPGYEDYVVPKAEFCQQCPHFADPPELACTHEGTEIVEVVETDRFRVRNCPMVDED